MKHLKTYEEVRWYSKGELGEDEKIDVPEEDGVYPGGEEFFKKFPIGCRVRIRQWIDDTKNVTGTVIKHEMRRFLGVIVVDGVDYKIFPTLTIKTDQRVIAVPDYNAMDDTYSNIISVDKMEYDVRGDGWMERIDFH